VTIDLDTDVRPRTVRLRADASRNRERIVRAAREAIVENGPEMALDDVARRAGVGNATLYRHFADRAALIRQVTLSVMAGTTRLAENALAEEPDAFSALSRFVFEAAGERIGALCPMLCDAIDERDMEVTAQMRHMERSITAIVVRAQHDGQLRGDIAVGDLMIVLTQLTRPLPGVTCIDFDHFANRHLRLFLDGLRAPARSELEGSAATLDDLKGCLK
jgi:AcrR family transcriptional regulator